MTSAGLGPSREPDLDGAKQAVRDRKALLDQVTQARRDALVALYRSGEIDYDVFTKPTRDMDVRDSGGGQCGA